MNKTLLQLFLRLFDLVIGQIETFRYEDTDNKEFWAEIGKDTEKVKRKVLERFGWRWKGY